MGISRREAVALGTGAEAARRRRVVVWAEGTAKSDFYPRDVNGAIADGLKPLRGWEVLTAGIDDPEQGLPDTLLNSTDVLIWWGHKRHGDVSDALADRIVKRVQQDGMGFIATHSSHFARPFQKVLGASGAWSNYAGDGSKLEVIVTAPKHPIARGVRDFICPHTERYCEPFQVPAPEAVVFDGIFTRPDGTTEHSRHGLTWTRGRGRVFYFQVGHEEYPMYLQPEVQRIFRNAVEWAAPK